MQTLSEIMLDVYGVELTENVPEQQQIIKDVKNRL